MKASKGKKAANLVKVVLVLLISLAVAAILIKTRTRPQREEVVYNGPLVEVIEVRHTSQNMIIRTYGTVRSGEDLNLTAEVGGMIVEMAPELEEGAFFHKGDFLLRIDPRDHHLAILRLEAEIRKLDADMRRIAQEKNNLSATLDLAQEDVALAKAEYERNVKLAQRNAVAQTHLDQSRQKWLASKNKAQEIKNGLALIGPRTDFLRAQRESAVAQLKQAQLDLERTEIRGPFDCRVAQKLVEKGQFVSKGGRLIRIYNTGTMEVEARIPTRDIAWLHFGAGGPVGVKGDTPVHARIVFDAAGRGLSWNGYVSRIKGEMDERTRTLPLVVKVENGGSESDHPLIPGMFVSVEIMGKRVDDVFILPQEAVHEDGVVYVVNQGEVKVKPVKILRRLDNRVYVEKGLSNGDLVIIRFPGVASQGMKVRVKQISGEQG